jgi:hypothetical protein
LTEIEGAETEEELPDVEKARAYAEQALKEKTPEEPEEPEDDEDEEIIDDEEEEEEPADEETSGGLKHQDGKQLDRAARRQAGRPIGTWLANFFNELNMKTDTDAKLAAETIKKFIEENKDKFMFSEAFTAKLLAECDKALSIKSLQEGLNKLLEERQVTCTWCGQDYPIDSCRNELDMGWLCDRCEQAMKSRGEKLTFEEDLMSTADAVKVNQDTHNALKGAADGLKNMVSAMKG